MTTFGKLLMLVLFALLVGAGALVVQNFERAPTIPIGRQAPPSETTEVPLVATTTETIWPVASTTPAAATTTPPKKPAPEAPTSAVTPSFPTLTPPPTTASAVQPDWNKINADTRGALANIVCTAKNGDLFEPLSGSGVFIDPRGVILTNAHVAEYLLLTGGDIKSNLLTCVVRVGNPAAPRYTADILFISPQWVRANAAHILDENPKERGDNDYALLRVTGTTNPEAAVSDSFPFLPLRETSLGNEVFLAAGYPAGFLGGIAIQRELWSASSFATIVSRYTFTADTLDLVGLGGNILAQQGSSGGALVDGEGKLAGLIVTATLEGATDTRDVRALTTDYINRAFAEESSISLFEIKNTNLDAFAAQFAREVLPALRTKLTDVISKTN